MAINEHLGIDLRWEDDDLVADVDGDLGITTDGRQTLGQDLKNLIIMRRGDLFSHPDEGGDAESKIGQTASKADKTRLNRAIVDACLYSDSLGPRIQPDTLEIDIVNEDPSGYELDVSVIPANGNESDRVSVRVSV